MTAPNQTPGTGLSYTREHPRPSQKERVRRMLARGWVCSIDFLNGIDGYAPIIRYGSRIHEIRREGWLIDRRPCQNTLHNHGHGVQLWQWKIVGHVDDGKLPGIGDA